MPGYAELEKLTDDEQDRCLSNLLSIRNHLRSAKGARLPSKNLDQTLIVATWNIRELGRNQKYGARLPEALLYLGAVISAFDLVALQEVDEDLGDFRRLMQILGKDWDYLLTDITTGHRGNSERMAFVYDRRKVAFEGLAGQVVVPEETRRGATTLKPRRQLARTPMMVGFRCGWFRFTVCTVHVYYGKGVANEPTRLQEIETISELMASRARSEHAFSPNMLVLGDFNIFAPQDQTYQAIQKAGFVLPDVLRDFVAGDSGKHYDQIAILSSRYEHQTKRDIAKARGGSFRLFDKLFRDDQRETYEPYFDRKRYRGSAKEKERYYREWRTFQLSDHRPLWLELKSDFTMEDLAKRRQKVRRATSSRPAPRRAR